MDSPRSRSKLKCKKRLGGGRRGISRQPRVFPYAASKVLAQDCSAARFSRPDCWFFEQQQRAYVADMYQLLRRA